MGIFVGKQPGNRLLLRQEAGNFLLKPIGPHHKNLFLINVLGCPVDSQTVEIEMLQHVHHPFAGVYFLCAVEK